MSMVQLIIFIDVSIVYYIYLITDVIGIKYDTYHSAPVLFKGIYFMLILCIQGAILFIKVVFSQLWFSFQTNRIQLIPLGQQAVYLTTIWWWKLELMF